MNFILVAKADDPTVLMTKFEAQKKLGEVSVTRIQREDGSFHDYEWINKIVLNGNENPIEVNFVSYRMIVIQKDRTEKVVYRNQWVTDFVISKTNVQDIVLCGRARWKIENECFNSLKNQGYCLEHNYGHGNHNLSFIFYLFIMVAFLFHQISDLTDELYQAVKEKFKNKKVMWSSIKTIINYLLFENWEQLFHFVLNPKELYYSSSGSVLSNAPPE